MERKIGTLGISPIKAVDLGHSGTPDPDGHATEKYLGDRLNLNIVYSVYHEPKSLEEISEELGVVPVFLEDKINMLEANGFLVRTAKGRFTTYANFQPRTYSLELADTKLKAQQHAAEIIAEEYVPLVRRALVGDIEAYIPGGNRELLEAAAVFYGINKKSQLTGSEYAEAGVSFGEKDLSKYYIKTLAGGHFIPWIELERTPSDPEYQMQFQEKDYCACGFMNRFSDRYPVSSWSTDTKFCSRTGTWENNLMSDYEYLYEFMKGTLSGDAENNDKIKRLINRGYLSEDGTVNILVVKDTYDHFFAKIPSLGKEIQARFVRQALEYAMMEAKEYPPQMQDLVIKTKMFHFIGNTTAIMVLDILYKNGTFRPLTDREKITSQLIMFSDILP